MKGEEGVWGHHPLEVNGMKRSQIKWKLLFFDESDFFSFEASLFLFSFNRAKLFILSQIKKRVFFKNKNKPGYWFKKYLFLILIIQLHTNKVKSIIVFLSRI